MFVAYVPLAAFDSTGLDNLYKQMTSQRSKLDVMYSPNVKHAEGFDKYSNVFIVLMPHLLKVPGNSRTPKV